MAEQSFARAGERVRFMSFHPGVFLQVDGMQARDNG